MTRADAIDMIARGLAALAAAERAAERASAPAPAAAVDWIPLAQVKIASRKRLRALCRSGAIEARRVGTRWLVRASSVDAFVRGAKASPENDQHADADDRMRRALGLRLVGAGG